MESRHNASGGTPETVEETNSSSQEFSSMLASASPTDRTAMLEDLVRQALSTGELGIQTSKVLQSLGQRQDLTAPEIRILEIIQDALSQGDVRQTEA